MKTEFDELTLSFSFRTTGEVHSTTAHKATNSNLIQITSRGNSINNFVKIEVSDDTLHVTHHNEVGWKPKHNNLYEEVGNLTIDKSGETTEISAQGTLEILDSDKPLIHFDFETMVPMASRPVTAMKQMDGNRKVGLVASNTVMRDVTCNDAIPNQGEFGGTS